MEKESLLNYLYRFFDIIVLLFITIIIANVFVVFKFFSRIAAIDTKKWANSVAIYQIVEIVPKSLSLLIIPLSVYYSEEIIMKKARLQSERLWNAMKNF